MLNRLSTRVGKMKQVLEDILNDDQEMQDMYLGQRAGDFPTGMVMAHSRPITRVLTEPAHAAYCEHQLFAMCSLIAL